MQIWCFKLNKDKKSGYQMAKASFGIYKRLFCEFYIKWKPPNVIAAHSNIQPQFCHKHVDGSLRRSGCLFIKKTRPESSLFTQRSIKKKSDGRMCTTLQTKFVPCARAFWRQGKTARQMVKW